MPKGAGWRLIEQHFEDERNYEEKIAGWLQTAYEGQCEMNCNPHLFSLPAVIFSPANRVDLPSDSLSFAPLPGQAMFDASLAVRRKAFQVSATKDAAKQYGWLMDMKIELPYITATLWQRPNKKKIAWMLLVKNARIVKKLDTVRDVHTFYLVCQEISEMMPKDFVPPPAFESNVVKHLEKFQ